MTKPRPLAAAKPGSAAKGSGAIREQSTNTSEVGCERLRVGGERKTGGRNLTDRENLNGVRQGTVAHELGFEYGILCMHNSRSANHNSVDRYC